MNRIINIYFNRRMAVLTALGFASGLPLALTGATLQAWMVGIGVDIGTVGLFSLVAAPYTFKFLWSPLLDRYVPPLLGRRRGWLLMTQLSLVAAISVMGFTGWMHNLYALAAMAVTVAFFSASQDIVADAYRTDLLPAEERGVGAAVFVTGYRIAYILSASGTLILSGRYGIPWPVIYQLMAACMMIGIIATLLAPALPATIASPQTLQEAVVRPFVNFLSRSDGLLVLCFVILFKLPDVMVDTMKIPFLVKIGFTEQQIGAIAQGLGLGMSIIGALFGGGVVARLGLWRSLWVFGFLQAFSNLGFWVLAQTGPLFSTLVGVIAVENFCSGLVTAGFVAFLMSQCDQRFSATQYALLSSLMALTRVLGGMSTGYMAGYYGWRIFFTISIIAAIPGMILLIWVRPREQTTLLPARGFEVLPIARGAETQ